MKNVSAAKFVPDLSSLRGDRLTGCFPIDHTYVADAGRKLRAVMIFVDFPNAKASDLHGRYGSFDYYYDALAVEGLEFYTKSSFGKLSLTIDRVDKWFRMPKNDEEYHMSRVMNAKDHRDYIAEAVKLTENEVDYRKYDMLYIVPPKNAVNVPFSPTMCSRTTSDVFTSYGAQVGLAVTIGQDMHNRRGKLLVHETGHMMGMPDYYTYHPEEGETAFAHCGGWDVMGWIEGYAPDFLGYGKWRFGWFDDDQVECYENAGSFEQLLTPVETERGSKLAVIPIDEHSGYVCESRRGIALDAALGDRQGVLIYYVNGYQGSGDGCLTVIPPQPERYRRLDRWDNEELFGTGEGQCDSFTDAEHGITVKVLESGAEGDRIQIVRK